LNLLVRWVGAKFLFSSKTAKNYFTPRSDLNYYIHTIFSKCFSHLLATPLQVMTPKNAGLRLLAMMRISGIRLNFNSPQIVNLTKGKITCWSAGRAMT